MGILLAIQFINAFIGFYETTKAGNAIAALKSSIKPTATCKRNGEWNIINAGLLVPGDTVLLGSGSTIPADCRVNHSEIDVDQAALTGESLPVTFYKGDSCKMGSTVVRGEVEVSVSLFYTVLYCTLLLCTFLFWESVTPSLISLAFLNYQATVEFTGSGTFFGKTASLLQDHHDRSHLEVTLMTIMLYLVGLSVSLCVVNIIYLLVEGEGVREALSFTIVLLVASIPLAIEIGE